MSYAQPQKNDLVLPSPATGVLSALLMKKLTGACVSTIAYLRNLFDEEDFDVRSFSGVNIHVVKGTERNSPGAQCLTNWLRGAFDAIDKKFLKTLIFDIKDESNRLQERYSFTYSYTNNEVQCSVNSGDEANGLKQEVIGGTRDDIIRLLRNLLVATSARNRLPPKCVTSVRLHYFDEVTPEEYEPPGFKPFDGDTAVDFDGNTVKWLCGKVTTGFHTLTLKTRLLDSGPEPAPMIPNSVDCPCNLGDSDGSLLKCVNCGCLQHLACFKIFSEADTQSQGTHTCLKCSGSKSTDGFESAECVFRRVLSICAKTKSISIRKLTKDLNLDPESAMINIRRLQREAVIPKSAQAISIERAEFTFNINRAMLMQLKSKYFIQ